MVASRPSTTERSLRSGCLAGTRSSRLMQLNIAPWKFCVHLISCAVCVVVAVAHIEAVAGQVAGDLFNDMLVLC